MAFKGFPPEAFRFYDQLQADNSKAFWEAHKDTYASAVKEPMEALAAAVDPSFGSPHLFRPYRDVRFAKDKSPYKTAAGAVGEGAGGTAYYVQISAEGLLAASGYYMMASDQLQRFRDAVAGPAGATLEPAVAALRAAGYDVGGDGLKTAPRGYPRDHPRIELLRLKGLTVARSFPVTKWMHGAGARQRIERIWTDAAPVNDWLDDHVGPSELPPDDFR